MAVAMVAVAMAVAAKAVVRVVVVMAAAVRQRVEPRLDPLQRQVLPLVRQLQGWRR